MGQQKLALVSALLFNDPPLHLATANGFSFGVQ
jgi:hypothetical protein